MATVSGIIRILVVEDFEMFRQFLSSTLESRPEFVIAEASDGLEAVSRAERLQPDLILLDIGLPRLNGIAAARRIRKLSPASKIIFVTQEFDLDVVREALDLGAWGYIAKIHADIDLMAAVDAVLAGRHFVSSVLSARGVTTQSLTVSGD